MKIKVETMPVVNEFDLCDAVNLQYGVEIENVASLLFGEEYYNDSYKSFYFHELDTYTGRAWEDEEKIRLTNLVKTYLQDLLPGYQRCLIDVSW